MREAYGNSYGISMALAPDYWYLRWFDAKAMEPFVDWFGFMAYDLHGSWDADVLALGKLVRGQADMREISSNTLPLWFDGLNPAKINFGLAMYGRGYTLADPTCNQLLCPFAEASLPAPCTNFHGVMSLREIKQLIARKGLTPQYLADSMMKQITWDDQWIGYDDEDTFAAKKAWADSRCFGGTMVWSVDFEFAGSGDAENERYGDVVYIGTEVFETPTAQCSPPCVMVFPSSSLDAPKVVTMQPYTATLEVGTTTTTMVAFPTASTTTISVVNFFNNYVTSAQQPGDVLTLRPSIQLPPIMLVVTGQDDQTTTRTVLPSPLGGAIVASPLNPADVLLTSTATPATEWPWVPPPTPTPSPELEDDQDLPDFPIIVISTPSPPLATTTPFPTETTASIEPVTDLSKPTPPGSTRVRCNSWFFFACISWIDLGIRVDWWDIVLPPGEIGPGPLPPPLVKLPTNWGFKCSGTLPCLPPWPKMTVGPGGVFPPEPPRPTPCEVMTATLTIQSTSYGTTTTDGTVRTISTRSFSSEFPIMGCALTDTSIETTKTACAARSTHLLPRAAFETPRAIEPSQPAGDDMVAEPKRLRPRLLPRQEPSEDGSDCEDEDDPTLVYAYCTLTDSNDPDRAWRDILTNKMNPSNPAGIMLQNFTVIETTVPQRVVAFVFLTNVRRDFLNQFLKRLWDIDEENYDPDSPTLNRPLVSSCPPLPLCSALNAGG